MTFSLNSLSAMKSSSDDGNTAKKAGRLCSQDKEGSGLSVRAEGEESPCVGSRTAAGGPLRHTEPKYSSCFTSLSLNLSTGLLDCALCN